MAEGDTDRVLRVLPLLESLVSPTSCTEVCQISQSVAVDGASDGARGVCNLIKKQANADQR